MNQNTKAALTLLFISPILAELLSGSSPALKFFYPPYLVLQLLIYGVPALVIRELALRWKIGLAGIFLFGLGYGIFNEGLIAHTFLKYNFNPTWIFYICVWHALHSVLFPILITYFFYPEVKNQGWLGAKTLLFFILLAFTESAVFFFGPRTENKILFALYWLVILGLVFWAKFKTVPLVERATAIKTSKPFWFGLTTLLVFAVVYNLMKWPDVILNILIEAALFYGIWFILKKKNWLESPTILLYASGSYVATAIFALAQSRLDVILTSLIFIIILFFFARKVKNYTPPEIALESQAFFQK